MSDNAMHCQVACCCVTNKHIHLNDSSFELLSRSVGVVVYLILGEQQFRVWQNLQHMHFITSANLAFFS